jgi:hypothetical protein
MMDLAFQNQLFHMFLTAFSGQMRLMQEVRVVQALAFQLQKLWLEL